MQDILNVQADKVNIFSLLGLAYLKMWSVKKGRVAALSLRGVSSSQDEEISQVGLDALK